MKPLSVPGRLPGRRLALAHVAAQKAGTTRHCRWFLAVYSGLGPPITKKGDCRGKTQPVASPHILLNPVYQAVLCSRLAPGASTEVKPIVGFRSDLLPRCFMARLAVYPFLSLPGPGLTPSDGGEKFGWWRHSNSAGAPSAVHRLLTGLTPANWRGFCVACGSSIKKNPLKARFGLQ